MSSLIRVFIHWIARRSDEFIIALLQVSGAAGIIHTDLAHTLGASALSVGIDSIVAVGNLVLALLFQLQPRRN